MHLKHPESSTGNSHHTTWAEGFVSPAQIQLSILSWCPAQPGIKQQRVCATPSGVPDTSASSMYQSLARVPSRTSFSTGNAARDKSLLVVSPCWTPELQANGRPMCQTTEGVCKVHDTTASRDGAAAEQASTRLTELKAFLTSRFMVGVTSDQKAVGRR